jgi:hypothetical protein
VRVECYAGSRGEETPRAIQVGAQRHAVEEVLDRWFDGGAESGRPARRIFRVRLESCEVVLLEQEEGVGAWTLREPLRPRWS